MKQRAPSRSGRRPLQSRSAENLTSSYKRDPASVRVGVGRCRSAHELVTDTHRDRESHSPSPSSCASDAVYHHPYPGCRLRGRRPAGGGRHRSRSREPPQVERVLSQEERERAVENMHRKFSGRRKAVLNGFPIGCAEEVCVYVCVHVCTVYVCVYVSVCVCTDIYRMWMPSSRATAAEQYQSSRRDQVNSIQGVHGTSTSYRDLYNMSSSNSVSEL